MYDYAWAAGFYEGEGTATINRSRRDGREYVYPRLTVVQVEREPLERLRDIFGGSVYRHRKARGTWQEQWGWQISGRGAIKAASAMWPWLSCRRRRQLLDKWPTEKEELAAAVV